MFNIWLEDSYRVRDTFIYRYIDRGQSIISLMDHTFIYRYIGRGQSTISLITIMNVDHTLP